MSLLDLIEEEEPTPKSTKKGSKKTASEPKKATPVPIPPSPSPIDLEEDVDVPAANISDAVALALDCQHLEAEIEELEKKTKDKKEILRKKVEEQLPELMSSLNLRLFNLDDGTKIEIKPFYSASVPTQSAVDKKKDPDEKAALLRRREGALDWLRKNGAASLIKSEVIVEFPKGAEKIANQFYKDCQTSGFAAEKEVAVNANSLTAFIKEKIEAGVAVPEDLFGLYVGKQAKFTPPKR